jgi:ABC-type glycerol-3-phosphate transport system permease component
MRRRMHPVLTAVIAAVLLLFTGGPIVLTLFGSIVPDRVLFDPDRGLLSEGVSFDNYRYVFTGELPAAYQRADANRAMISDAARQVPESLLNSTEVAAATAILCLLLGAPAAFVFARYGFPGRQPAFLFLILSPLVPTVALVTPIYMTVEAMGLLGSKLGIILVHTIRALPLTVLILSIFFRRIPKELFEAAIIDGCSRLQLFLKIACPTALPSIAATGLFAFMLSYAEFIFAMVLSGDARSRSVSVVMAALARNTDVSWGLLNTAIFIALVPTLALVVIVWRFVVENVLAGAVKG